MSTGFGAVLLVGSAYGIYHSCFIAEYLPFGILLGAAVGVVIGAYWIWVNSVRPYEAEE